MTSMTPTPRLRRTRIVCISDTHNTLPSLPAGDILIHAGDLTNQGSQAELQRTATWLRNIDGGFRLKIVVAGNHDVTLDDAFYARHGSQLHNQAPQDVGACAALLLSAAETAASGIVYLRHEARTLEFVNADGTVTRVKVFGSPWSPSRGLWAFGYAEEDGPGRWADVPLDADIVVTHTPPKFHCDESPARGSAGCEALRRALWRVRPRLAVCGHVHEGRGVESVLWDLETPNVRFKEVETFYWNDGTRGTKKQFRVDLTGRSARPLQNDGGKGWLGSTAAMLHARGREVSPDKLEMENREHAVDQSPHDDLSPKDTSPKSPTKPLPQSELAEKPISPVARPTSGLPSTYGVGGLPATAACDFEALAGREGRRETCIVNAAIAGSSWPHPGGKRFNKPIVVDIDLPIVDLKQQDWFERQKTCPEKQA